MTTILSIARADLPKSRQNPEPRFRLPVNYTFAACFESVFRPGCQTPRWLMTYDTLLYPEDDRLPPAKWIPLGILAAVLLTCALGLSRNNADPDLWGHLQYGRDAIAHGLPETTTYSYSAEGYQWINHENLSELVMVLCVDNLGPQSLMALKCLLGVFIIGLVLYRAQQHYVSLVTMCVVAMLMTLNLSSFWMPRPQLASYACFALMLVMLNWSFAGWEGSWRLSRSAENEKHNLTAICARLRMLWLAPLLFVFWTNAHGGFVAGLAIYVAYLMLRCLEVFVRLRGEAWPLVWRLTLMASLALAATLVNPYGWQLQAWLFESLTVPRPEIVEWHPPDFLALKTLPIAVLIGVWAVSLICTRRSQDFTHLALMSLTLWQTLAHQRHLPFFVLMFGFWMPVHLESAFQRLRRAPRKEPRALPNSFVAVALSFTLFILTSRLSGQLKEMPVHREAYPVSAVQFIADQDLQGKMVVTYNWAQYIIAAFGSLDSEEGIQVAFDGRFRTCYPQEIVDMHFDLVLGDAPGKRHRGANSGPLEPTRVLDHAQPDMVLICREQPHSTRVMQSQQECWVLLYQDSLAQLWGRRARYDEPELPDYVPPAERRISDKIQQGSVSWPALPRRTDPKMSLVANDGKS